MTFFQVLITNEFDSSISRQYTEVYNYATLAEAMNIIKRHEYDVADGILFEEKWTGREMCQQKLQYVENGGAVLELRYEYFNEIEGCSIKQFSTQEAIYVKEIIL